jgi:hypothetical protein
MAGGCEAIADRVGRVASAADPFGRHRVVVEEAASLKEAQQRRSSVRCLITIAYLTAGDLDFRLSPT